MKIYPKRYWRENLALLMIFLCFVDLITENLHELIKWPLVVLGILAIVFNGLYSKGKGRYFGLICFIFLFVAIEVITTEGIEATQYIWDLLVCLPIGICVVNARSFTLKKWIFLYLAITALMMICYILAPDGYQMFYSHSRNYISVYDLYLLMMMAMAAYKTNQKIPAWTIYFTNIFCIVAVGRGGIISELLMTTLYVIYRISSDKNRTNKSLKIIITVIITVSIVLVLLIFGDYIIQKYFPRFAHTGMEATTSSGAVSKRLRMWGMYIASCVSSVKNFLLGADPRPIHLAVNYRIDFNLHNSYVMTHVFYGIIGLLAVVVSSFKFIKQMIVDKEYEVIIIFIAFLVRAFTDSCFPGDVSGSLMWLVILFALQNTSRKKKKRYESNTRVFRNSR